MGGRRHNPRSQHTFLARTEAVQNDEAQATFHFVFNTATWVIYRIERALAYHQNKMYYLA